MAHRIYDADDAAGFGNRLPELRWQAGLSRGVIIRLAESLNKNKSELINIAGKTPVKITRMRERHRGN